MSLLTALGYYLGGQGKAKQQRFDNEQAVAKDRAQADYQNRTLAETTRYDNSQIASQKAQNDAALRAQGIDPATGQPYPLPAVPKSLQQIIPNQQAFNPRTNPLPVLGSPEYAGYETAHYRGMAALYLRGDAKLGIPPNPAKAAEYEKLATDAALDAQRTSNATLSGIRGNEITQGKIPLEQAQAKWYSQRKQLAEEGFQNAYRIASAHDQARMNAAASSARSRLAGSNADYRETIALMTGLNAASGKDSTQAFETAKVQFEADHKDWAKRADAAALDNTPAPPAPPAFESYVANALANAARPSTTNVTVVLPDGRSVKVPTVTNTVSNANTGGGGDARIQKLRSIVHAARANNPPYPDSAIRSRAIANGYSAQEIDSALGTPAVAPLPVARPGSPAIRGINPALLPVR